MNIVNEGTLDRSARVVLGIAILAAGWSGLVGGVPGQIFQWLGFVPLITGLAGICPLYLPFGLSTKPKA